MSQKVKPSEFEKCNFINNRPGSPLEYSAFFGALRRFKCILLDEGTARCGDLMKHAVAGGDCPHLRAARRCELQGHARACDQVPPLGIFGWLQLREPVHPLLKHRRCCTRCWRRGWPSTRRSSRGPWRSRRSASCTTQRETKTSRFCGGSRRENSAMSTQYKGKPRLFLAIETENYGVCKFLTVQKEIGFDATSAGSSSPTSRAGTRASRY